MLRLLVFAAALAAASPAQQPPPAPTPQETAAAPDRALADYVLGPDDQISIRAVDAGEVDDKPVRIDMSGYLRLPMIGRVKAAGLTVEQLQAELVTRLKEFVKDPDVAVSVVEFRSQPVSVIGSVRNPGVHQLQGRKTLVEILSLAGGLAPDAGHSVKITRTLENGRVPVAGAQDDPSGRYSVAEIGLKDIMQARSPGDNILIQPHDVISVPRAEMVYVTGQVMKSGGFILNDNETLSALQALSLAGGLDRTAAPQNSRILRASTDGVSRAEIEVDLKKILAGKSADVALQPNDILFVPASGAKKAAVRAIEAAIQMGTGVVIWRR